MTNMEYYMTFCLSTSGFKCEITILFCNLTDHKRNEKNA